MVCFMACFPRWRLAVVCALGLAFLGFTSQARAQNQPIRGVSYKVQMFHAEKGWEDPHGRFDVKQEAFNWGNNLCRDYKNYERFRVITIVAGRDAAAPEEYFQGKLVRTITGAQAEFADPGRAIVSEPGKPAPFSPEEEAARRAALGSVEPAASTFDPAKVDADKVYNPPRIEAVTPSPAPVALPGTWDEPDGIGTRVVIELGAGGTFFAYNTSSAGSLSAGSWSGSAAGFRGRTERAHVNGRWSTTYGIVYEFEGKVEGNKMTGRMRQLLLGGSNANATWYPFEYIKAESARLPNFVRERMR